MLETLHRKTRAIVERELLPGEHVLAVVPGRFKQALLTTEQRLFLVKPGFMASATFGVTITSFSFGSIAGISTHIAPGGGVIEILDSAHSASAGSPAELLKAAPNLPNCLPCSREAASHGVIGELRTFVERSAHAQSRS